MTHPYYTHRKYLKQILDSFDYTRPVHCLELGTGDGSALIFNQYIKNNKNLFVTAYEDNHKWLEKTQNKYEIPNYSFNKIENWSTFNYDLVKDKVYDLIFVDHMVSDKKWQERINSVENLKNHGKYIIVHDYDYYNKKIAGHGYGKNSNIYSVQKNSFWYDRYAGDFELTGHKEKLPPTLIMKNKKLNHEYN